MVASLLLYTPIPAGFRLAEEKSPPSAPNAPPIAVDLAVPPKKFCEYLRASVSFWALRGASMKQPVIMNIYIVFMISIFNWFRDIICAVNLQFWLIISSFYVLSKTALYLLPPEDLLLPPEDLLLPPEDRLTLPDDRLPPDERLMLPDDLLGEEERKLEPDDLEGDPEDR